MQVFDSAGKTDVGPAVPDGFGGYRHEQTTTYIIAHHFAPVRHSRTYDKSEFLDNLSAWEREEFVAVNREP